jgi:hypothetical protein
VASEPLDTHTAMSDSTTAAPSTARRVRLWLTAVFIVGVLVQVYLAGRGIFGVSNFDAHKEVGNAIHGVSALILIATLFGTDMRNRTDVGLALALLVLTTIQMAIGSRDHPDVAAFHPVNAFLIMGAAAGILARDRRLSAPPPSAAPAA